MWSLSICTHFLSDVFIKVCCNLLYQYQVYLFCKIVIYRIVKLI